MTEPHDTEMLAATEEFLKTVRDLKLLQAISKGLANKPKPGDKGLARKAMQQYCEAHAQLYLMAAKARPEILTTGGH